MHHLYHYAHVKRTRYHQNQIKPIMRWS